MFDYSTGILLGVAWLTCGLHTFILKCYRNRREIYTDHSNYMSAGGNNTIYALGMLSVITCR